MGIKQSEKNEYAGKEFWRRIRRNAGMHILSNEPHNNDNDSQFIKGYEETVSRMKKAKMQ